jgi:hypothetical protein
MRYGYMYVYYTKYDGAPCLSADDHSIQQGNIRDDVDLGSCYLYCSQWRRYTS